MHSSCICNTLLTRLCSVLHFLEFIIVCVIVSTIDKAHKETMSEIDVGYWICQDLVFDLMQLKATQSAWFCNLLALSTSFSYYWFWLKRYRWYINWFGIFWTLGELNFMKRKQDQAGTQPCWIICAMNQIHAFSFGLVSIISCSIAVMIELHFWRI